ncbi:DUF559 domain-containing protein [Micromonospora zamorensis]|uniref:endonuclease domain-containing protein n=1 Tax=Micromonospora zamorensis TaxID=709883 RepID=UPI0033CB1663
MADDPRAAGIGPGQRAEADEPGGVPDTADEARRRLPEPAGDLGTRTRVHRSGMPAFRRQMPIRVGRRTVYPDMFAERELVNIELDGATIHGDPRQREIDLRRDALLASIGILVVRFTHRRLVHEADAVRQETLAILATRRC